MLGAIKNRPTLFPFNKNNKTNGRGYKILRKLKMAFVALEPTRNARV